MIDVLEVGDLYFGERASVTQWALKIGSPTLVLPLPPKPVFGSPMGEVVMSSQSSVHSQYLAMLVLRVAGGGCRIRQMAGIVADILESLFVDMDETPVPGEERCRIMGCEADTLVAIGI